MVSLKVQFLDHFCSWYISIYHFPDGTYLVHFNKSVNRLSKYISIDMKNLTNWLNANKISLNVRKTELVIFKHKNKKLECPIKIKLSRKRLHPSKSVKYLGFKTDENMNWKDQTYDIVAKLNRANALLWFIYKLRKPYMGSKPEFQVKNYYFTEKSFENLNNQPRNSHSGPLFKKEIFWTLKIKF